MKQASRALLVFVILYGLIYINDAENSPKHCHNGEKAIKRLVDPATYDKVMRPCENGQPLVVRAGMYIVSINNVEESDMTFDIQIYFRQRWRDHRLAYDGLNISREDHIELSPGYFRDMIWMPDPYFQNEKIGRFHNIMSDNQLIYLSPDGIVYFSARLSLTLYCPMEFYDFPMDKQVCKIIFASYGHSTKNIIYKWMTNKTETSVLSNKLRLPQFAIVKMGIETNVETYEIGNFSILTLRLYLRRRMEFYLIRNYIPAVFIVIVSWLSFWVDRDSAPARVCMGITTILTMTTLLIGVGQQQLPVVSYMKALDWYYIGCFVFVFAALCEYAIVNYFDQRQRHHIALLKMDNTDLAEDKCEVKSNQSGKKSWFEFGMEFSQFSKPHQEPEDEQSKEIRFHSQFNDIIDDTFRKIYPLFFIIFNITYWAIFYPLEDYI